MTPRFLRFAFVSLLALLAAPLFAQNGDKAGELQRPLPDHLVIPPAPVLTAIEELKTFKVAPGFHIEAVATDPLVGDPIAIAFGPDGRLWVVEMRGYMQDVDATGEREPVGDIAVLEDTDGDGRMDKRTVFLDKLVLPRALSLVGDGVLVAEPPHLWFCRDTNGDGVADSKVEVASDYGGTGNIEHMANGLVTMMDNWIYSANFTARFRSQGGEKFERDATITRGQWGIAQDDRGRLYYNSNSDPLRIDAVPSAYFKRNPNLGAVPGTNFQLAPASLPVWPGRVTPGINRGYKTLRPDGTLPAVTAACGPVIYRGALFPEEFRGNAFICEPSGNLVKRIVLTERDGAIKGTNAYEHTEFLTSTDERFRPVSAYNGPDGALWIVDLYRGVIQHRTYVTTYLRNQVKSRNLEEGRGLGRIWRIVPDGAPAYAKPTLATATPAQLVEKLADANGWVRDTAQRLLVEKLAPAVAARGADPEAAKTAATVQALRALARSGSATVPTHPLARLHALWTLDGIGALNRPILLAALGDGDPRVCAAAIRLAEKFLVPPGDAEVLARVSALLANSDPAVRLQLALSLGEVRTAAGDQALRTVVTAAGSQPFVAEAAVSGLAGREEEWVEALWNEAATDGPAVASALSLGTSATLRSGDAARITRVLALTGDVGAPAWARRAILDGVQSFLPRRADGATVAGSLPAEPTALVALASLPDSEDAARAAKLLKLLRWPGKAGMVVNEVKLAPAEKVLFEKGRAQYTALCANCHQPNGQGLAGLAPPLVNSRWVLGPDHLLARIVLCGKEDEGKVMPTLKAVLDDETIAGTLTFIRNSWGHAVKAVKPETVAQARKETATREEPFHEEELVEMSGG